jgi:hypothetical protein
VNQHVLIADRGLNAVSTFAMNGQRNKLDLELSRAHRGKLEYQGGGNLGVG